MSEPVRTPLGMNSARDLFEKVRRDAAQVDSAVTPDAMFNFFVSAHALNDWVAADAGLSSSAKKECVELLKSNDCLKVCRDLANGSKHFEITRYRPIVSSTNVQSGYGIGRFGVGPYGEGELVVAVAWAGEQRDVREIVGEILTAWTSFFSTHR